MIVQILAPTQRTVWRNSPCKNHTKVQRTVWRNSPCKYHTKVQRTVWRNSIPMSGCNTLFREELGTNHE